MRLRSELDLTEVVTRRGEIHPAYEGLEASVRPQRIELRSVSDEPDLHDVDYWPPVLSNPSSRTMSASPSPTAASTNRPSEDHDTRRAMKVGRSPKSVI